jgi:phenylacetate-CoA ligase
MAKSCGAQYKKFLHNYNKMFFHSSYDEIRLAQEQRFLEFVSFCRSNNSYYKEKLSGLEIKSLEDISKIPVLSKDQFRKELTVSETEERMHVGFTGGTTGRSTRFYLTQTDLTERFANLDFFRGLYGYTFGDKAATFSGKEIITHREEKRGKYWVKDFGNNITYFSTFHLFPKALSQMIHELNSSKPEYFIGFSSSIVDLARFWKASGEKCVLKLKAIFPTSEPLLKKDQLFLREFFDCPVPDQYASSEGAPFLYECPQGSLHLDLYSGVFEKKDPGQTVSPVLVTSFTTHGMPLVRFDIGDLIDFGDYEVGKCSCGSQMPVINAIEGRDTSYVSSPDRGKVTVSNLCNVIKYMTGVNCFQIIQNAADSIEFRVVSDRSNQAELEKELEYELRYRLGDSMKIVYKHVQHIPKEPSGKYIMIKRCIDE